MSVRKRTWFTESDVKAKAKALAKTAGGTGDEWCSYEDDARKALKQEPPRVAWIVDYRDLKGDRTMQTFATKKEADAFNVDMKAEMRDGTHTSRAKSVTIAEAGALWLATAEASALERATIVDYKRHLDLHIAPRLGRVKLSELSTPAVRAFEDRLRQDGRSAAMVRKVRTSLSMLLADAVERGLVNRNVARELRRGKDRRDDREQLKVGVDIPELDEVRKIVACLQGRWRPLLLTAIFCGLRASELRGLQWSDVDFAKREIRVCQRADRYNKIGPPKSKAGNRAVPVPPLVLNALREWRLSCPKGDLDLAFPTRIGTVESLGNIASRGLWPAQVAAGVTVDGKPKYPGLHALRHFYASWCINRTADGGLGLPPKTVQERLGHSSIMMTLDVYGHLFPRGDDGDELAAAERSLIG
jgi:integrase